MSNIHSILCPVDFSEHSRRALLWASVIAQHRGAEITVLSVVDRLLAQAAGIRLGVDLAHAETEPSLREFVEATLSERVRQGLHIQIEVTVGDPAEVILQAGRRLNAGLIVMGTHGRGGFEKLLLGSTTEQVLRETEWPVLAVPRAAVDPPALEHPGVQLRRILLATDFREGAVAAAQWAAELASDVRVPLVLAHVVEPVIVLQQWQALVADFDSDAVASGQRMLEKLSSSIHDTHTDCVVRVGHPADTIASLADEYGAGLIVMGLANPDSDRRNPGSIAYRTLRMASAAIVVVPAPRRKPLPEELNRKIKAEAVQSGMSR